MDALSACVGCRKRRRACSKELPRCSLCARTRADCVFKLAGVLRSALPLNAPTPPEDSDRDTYHNTDIIFNGEFRPRGALALADTLQGIRHTKRACVKCHESKRSCKWANNDENTEPCTRCAKLDLPCIEWIPERGSNTRGINEGRLEGGMGRTSNRKQSSVDSPTSPVASNWPATPASLESHVERSVAPGRPVRLAAKSAQQKLAVTIREDDEDEDEGSLSASSSDGSLTPDSADGTLAQTSEISSHGLKATNRVGSASHSAAGGLTGSARMRRPSQMLSPALTAQSSGSISVYDPGSSLSASSYHSLTVPGGDEMGLISTQKAGSSSSYFDIILGPSSAGSAQLLESQMTPFVGLSHSTTTPTLFTTIDPALLHSGSMDFLDSDPADRKTKPGSWWPPVSPPPRFVDLALSPFPTSFTIAPKHEHMDSLLTTFWETCHDVFPFLHLSTFAETVRKDRILFSALGLAAFHGNKDPEVISKSQEIQQILYQQAISGISAILDRHLPDGLDPSSNSLPEESTDPLELDHLCETLFAMCMLGFWASNVGRARLFGQIVDLAFRLSLKVGLHCDPKHKSDFGRGKRGGWIRREQRKFLWFSVQYQVLFANHFMYKRWIPFILPATGAFVLTHFSGHLFHTASLDPDFNPDKWDPENQPVFAILGRPAKYEDMVSWIKIPVGRPDRLARLAMVGKMIADPEFRYDTRYTFIIEWIFWNMREEVNAILSTCREEKVTVTALAEGKAGSFQLRKRRDRMERCIADFLECLPPALRKAEEDGDYPAVVAFFVDNKIDKRLIAAHVSAQYLVTIRTLRMELKSGFGGLTFTEIARGDMNHEFTKDVFRDCLQDGIVFTNHIKSLLTGFDRLGFDLYHTGLVVPKIGALHLAMLGYCLSQKTTKLDRSIVQAFRTDMDACLSFVHRVSPPDQPAGSKQWHKMVRRVFDKLVTALAVTEGYRRFFGPLDGSAILELPLSPVLSDLAPPVALPEPTEVEIEKSLLRRDMDVGDTQEDGEAAEESDAAMGGLLEHEW